MTLQTAASASSPVTSWRHYDSIYTERYMWIPSGNKEGYDASNAMSLAKNLQGRLLLYYGTADNNVHPNNTMELIKALQAASGATAILNDLQVFERVGDAIADMGLLFAPVFPSLERSVWSMRAAFSSPSPCSRRFSNCSSSLTLGPWSLAMALTSSGTVARRNRHKPAMMMVN